MKEAEHTDPPGGPARGNIFVNVAHMSRFLQSESSDHALYGHFLGDSFVAALLFFLGGGGTSRYIIQRVKPGPDRDGRGRFILSRHFSPE